MSLGFSVSVPRWSVLVFIFLFFISNDQSVASFFFFFTSLFN
ncbi:hypothetical protein SLEP1_g18612 [Rubroshorea leprosula]|uniref:Uncharacterized protein n=1 Tax=Rubroshorea leprosula TaxID=152421 RepID=A0AAV5J5R4_9ROSI|nr:hypothetical protein SLEP1_g18612 [Rubroshorea leprosula]